MKLKHRGIDQHRLAPNQNNPREVAFAAEWESENVAHNGVNFGQGILQDLMFRRIAGGSLEVVHRIDQRDAEIVATVIQWLGSNCGMGFLHAALKRCGHTVVDSAVQERSQKSNAEKMARLLNENFRLRAELDVVRAERVVAGLGEAAEVLGRIWPPG